ncbi:hypothetical protein N9H10_04370 [Luminiphilus sp.]|nr:hypothetical protein [Luminiphilus sp.]MDA8986286.1 hypothetical protein [Luminiphilus sp.]MDB2643764.1 hypothetical protein [Luminiphilus sp.]
MTIASCIWIGVEYLATDVAVAALRQHRRSRQVFCGRLAVADDLRRAVNEQPSAPRADGLEPEWHDADAGTIIGGGLLSDLLRQRRPVEEVVLVLPPWDAPHHCGAIEALASPLAGSLEMPLELSLEVPLEVTLDHARGFIERVAIGAAAAKAVMSAPASRGMTILSQPTTAGTALGAGLQALTETWVRIERPRWQQQRLQLNVMQPEAWLSERAETTP